LVEPRLREMKRPTLAAARELAEEFSASLTATLVKMTALNRFPMVIVCNIKTTRPGYRKKMKRFLSQTAFEPRKVRLVSKLQTTAAAINRF